MGRYDFTYTIPNAFKKNMIQYLIQNYRANIAQAYDRVRFEYNDLGFARYAGLSGDNWNKHAIDVTLEGSENDIELLKSSRKILENTMSEYGFKAHYIRPFIEKYLFHCI